MGGPGQTATEAAAAMERSPYRDDREIVLVDQRGTSADLQLDCNTGGSADDVQGYLSPLFSTDAFARCRAQLESRADLTQYTTARSVEDLEAIRGGLGYPRIGLLGISYGTRVALMYMRRYPSRVHAAVLSGLVPPSFRNPLHHASAAQEALDSILGDCAASAPCAQAFPDLPADLDSVAARLRRRPVRVPVMNPFRGDSVTIALDRDQFAEALRVLMYTPGTGRFLPLFIHQASAGDYRGLVQAALNSSRNRREGLRMGMLMSVVCSEDVPRIAEQEIVTETRGTLLGDARVRQQMAACRIWPRGAAPVEYTRPFTVPVPTLLVSGTRDPVTPRRWGEATRAHLPASVHVVVPGAHGVNTRCIARIAGQLLDRRSVAGLDTSCVAGERYGDFVLP
jgi:pimeloyl-ACP methyl ester carboxylesterase